MRAQISYNRTVACLAPSTGQPSMPYTYYYDRTNYLDECLCCHSQLGVDYSLFAQAKM